MRGPVRHRLAGQHRRRRELTTSGWRARARAGLPGPLLAIDLLQNAKTVLAGVLAWVVATEVLGLELPFLAPWAAVLVVHATVYRTVSRGGQQVAATFLGVFLGSACGNLLGIGWLGMGTMLAVAFLLGQHRWLREEATTIATTGIVVLATNTIGESNLLTSRLLDTTVGIGVGLLVNLLVWPPLRDRAAWARADELPHDLADVLGEMASGLGPDLDTSEVDRWIERLRVVDVRVDEAWALLGQARESSRFNLRRSKPAGLDDLVRMLHLLEQALADTLSMARTVATSAENATVWDQDFRSRWTELLTATAEAVKQYDETRISEIRAELGRVAQEISTKELQPSSWQEYGGVLINLRNVVNSLGQVLEWANQSGPATRRSKRFPVRGAMHRP